MVVWIFVLNSLARNLIFILLLLHVKSFALDIDANTSNVELLSYASIYVDTTNLLSKEEVQKLDFEVSKEDVLGLGFVPNTAVWIRFTLTNSTNEPIEKILEYDNPETEDLLFFDGDREVHDGMFHISPLRKSIHPSFVIKLDAFEERTFYIKAHCKISTLIVKLVLWEREDFMHHDFEHKSYLFVFFTVMFTLLLYNFMLLLFTKDKAYLYYVLYLLGAIFFQSIYLGMAQLYFLSNELSIFLTKATTFYISLLVFPIILFTRQFLETRQFKCIDAILKFYLYLIPVLILISFDNFLVTLDILVVFIPLGFVMVYTGFYALSKGVRQAKFYIMGWSFLIASLVLSVLRSLGLFDITLYFLYVNEVAFALEALLFSIALAHRIKILNEEKNHTDAKLIRYQQRKQIHLNTLVNERTKKLKNALDTHQLLYSELNHRVKNNLAMILSLIQLQIEKDESLQPSLQITKDRIHSIAKLYELLDLEQDTDQFDTVEYFKRIVENIQLHCVKVIDVSYDIQTRLTINNTLYCGLILNELVTNAYKYAFENIGNIYIKLYKIHNTFILHVKDDGKGFQSKNNTSLGLTIVKILVEKQLLGNFEIASTPLGTEISIKWNTHE